MKEEIVVNKRERAETRIITFDLLNGDDVKFAYHRRRGIPDKCSFNDTRSFS